MSIARPRAVRRKPEPVIALINIVFLMLIFFLVAGTVAAPLDPSLKLIDTTSLEGRAPPDALVLMADGTLRFRGAPTDVAAFMTNADDAAVRIVPDRAVPAQRLVEVTLALRAAGAGRVLVVTARGLE
jgi:biopolymer transport protein ExbD